MDARERLRQYLEQRREMGESELVLDSLPVEDVLRLLGDKQPPPARGAVGSGSSRDAVSAPSARDAAPTSATNWRDALASIGAEAPRSPASKPSASAKPGVPSAKPSVPSAKPAVPSASATPAAPLAKPTAADDTLAGAAPSEPATPPPIPGAGIIVGSAMRDLLPGPLAALGSLDEVATHIAACRGCTLHQTAKNPVPGEGNPHAGFVCVGEAPGQTEDELGRPFVGRAGDLLTKILEAIQLTREDVFICNVLKHRPPGNRNPAPDEIKACSPYLMRQLELLQPRVILALGTFASQTLLQTKEPIGKLRGLVHRFHGVPLIVTYHPAALLRNPAWKRPTWEDVQLARRIFDSAAQG
ncbi:MAG: uracil-DNA glycosylase family protein [Gemmatimonadaceae bacterium]|nr:uracil-DNA glycosylase family protein [Gemmatimonadaceae bacterium]